jgi:hypothetical protein
MARRYLLLLILSVAGAMAPLASAFAHFGLYGDKEIGHGLFWMYGIAFTGLAAFIIYRKRSRAGLTPEQHELRQRVADLERALTACMTQLQNAEDYPNECGLTYAEREERLVSASSIREKIAEINAGVVVH